MCQEHGSLFPVRLRQSKPQHLCGQCVSVGSGKLDVFGIVWPPWPPWPNPPKRVGRIDLSTRRWRKAVIGNGPSSMIRCQKYRRQAASRSLMQSLYSLYPDPPHITLSKRSQTLSTGPPPNSKPTCVCVCGFISWSLLGWKKE